MSDRPTAVQFRDDLVRLAMEAYDRVHVATDRERPGSVGHRIRLDNRDAFALHMRERAAQAAQVFEVYASINEQDTISRDEAREVGRRVAATMRAVPLYGPLFLDSIVDAVLSERAHHRVDSDRSPVGVEVAKVTP